MLSRLQKRRGEDGFTLIELLVVIIIIGILAAIAIPVFLSQRANAWTAAVESDVRNAALAQESLLTSGANYVNGAITGPEAAGGVSAGYTTLNGEGFTMSDAANYLSDSQTITSVAVGSTSYTLTACSAQGYQVQFSSSTGSLNTTDASGAGQACEV